MFSLIPDINSFIGKTGRFVTRDVITAHELAFAYYGGMTKEIVNDQDHLLLVSENYGNLILTHEFATYVRHRGFHIRMCRKQDPESKGRIEKVVQYVKRNFARHRIFVNVDKLNEDCMAWLDRTGNAFVHHTTKKIPAEVFALEKLMGSGEAYLRGEGSLVEICKKFKIRSKTQLVTG